MTNTSSLAVKNHQNEYTSYPVLTIAQALVDIRRKYAKRYHTEKDISVAFRKNHLEAFVFLAHGVYQSVTGVPLVNEAPCAWDRGPTFPTLYHQGLRNSLFEVIGFNTFRHNYVEPDFMAMEIIEATYHTFATKSEDALIDMLLHSRMWIDSWKETKYGEIPQKRINDFFNEIVLSMKIIPFNAQKKTDSEVNELKVRIEYDELGLIKNNPIKEMTDQLNLDRHNKIASKHNNLSTEGLTVFRGMKDEYTVDVLFFPDRTAYQYEFRIIDPDCEIHTDPNSHADERSAYDQSLIAIEALENPDTTSNTFKHK